MLFQYCYAIAVSHRKDTAMVPIPPIAEIFPANFVEPSVFRDARTEGSLITNPGDRVSPAINCSSLSGKIMIFVEEVW